MGEGDAGIPMDIFSLFKRVITRHFTSEQLEHFSLNTQRENEHLFGLVKELKAINVSTTTENKQLRGQLAQFQKELADLRGELNRIRTRGYESSKPNTFLISARRPPAAAASPSATHGNGGAASM